MARFDGRIILVTGAASGIGAATVRRLASEGATVIAADLTEDALASLDITGIERVVLDVTDQKSALDAVTAARERHGALNGLVNCAGIAGIGSILDVEPEAYRKVMAVNLEGTINMCQAYVRAVQADADPRVIVNISSGAGLMGVANRLPYVASKFGVSGITKSMSPELGPLGIRVNAVAPGVTRTPFMDYALRDPEVAKRIIAAHPIGRIGEPEEIAAAILFLLSDDASFITGTVMSVDGGQTACL